jgi:Zn-dependent M16 (insulinase) family peptidase
MKGAMSGADRMTEEKMREAMFPSNCYRYNSGGDPAVIPSLTYERLVEQYKKYYHPSNAKVFLDGNIPVEETFELLGSYLGRFEPSEVKYIIPYQKPRATEQSFVFELAKEEQIKDQEILSIGILFGDWRDRAKTMAVSVLKDVLFDSNESPVKRALLSSGLAKEMTANVEDVMKQSYLEITVKNMEGGRANDVLDLIRGEIKSPFIRSFLYYVPYAVLAAMTIPDVLYSTGYAAGGSAQPLWCALCGLAVAVVLAWRGKSLLTVAVAACAGVAAAQGVFLLIG